MWKKNIYFFFGSFLKISDIFADEMTGNDVKHARSKMSSRSPIITPSAECTTALGFCAHKIVSRCFGLS